MKKYTAKDLKNPQVIDAVLEFRKSYKRHWPSALNALAEQWKVKAGDLNQLLTEYQTAKKEKEKKEAKNQSILNSLPKNSYMNYKWEENEEGELVKTPKLTDEVWQELKEAFTGPDGTEWPKNIRGQLLLWDHRTNRPNLLPPSIQTKRIFSTLYSKGKIIFWEENKAKGFMPQAEFVDSLTLTLPRYESYSEAPHYPPIKGVFYHCKTPGTKKTGKLEELVNMFKPASPADKDKIRALFCTAFWGGPAGQRPMFIITAQAIHGQSSGKTTIIETLSQLISERGNGYVKFTLESNKLDGETFKTRMLGTEGQRLIFFDNVRSAVVGAGWLEDNVTSSVISGHKMHIGLDTIPNHFTTCLTLNDSTFSSDVVTRAMVIQILPHNTDDGKKAEWMHKLNHLLTEHRQDIIDDIILTLKSPIRKLNTPNRFPIWCEQVMSKCTEDPDLVGKNIALAAEYNAENEEAEKIHEDILGEISRYKVQTLMVNQGYMHLDWDTFPKMYIRISEAIFLQWICKSLGFRASQTKLAKKKLTQLILPWLKKDKEGIPYTAKAKGSRFYTYGNPDYPEPDSRHMIKIINTETFLDENRHIKSWIEEAPKTKTTPPKRSYDQIPNPFSGTNSASPPIQ